LQQGINTRPPVSWEDGDDASSERSEWTLRGNHSCMDELCQLDETLLSSTGFVRKSTSSLMETGFRLPGAKIACPSIGDKMG